MSSIDERIVKMTFDNQSFENGISKTIQSLEKLNEVLKNTGNADAVNGLSKSIKDIKSQLSTLDLDKINSVEVKDSIWKKIGSGLSTAGKGLGSFINKLNLGGTIDKLGSSFSNAVSNSKGLDKSVESVTAKFSALGVVGATALANITNRMVNLSTNVLKTLTLEPITTGFSEYETKVNSIATILANTADKGETLDTVTAALNELNKYSDDTIYNFAQMTDNIGKFTAAGVGLDDSVAAIKGMANLAALFGVDATKASGAMYQMSQALAAGKVQLMDWNSLQNAGMGGTKFQDALIRTSEVLGTGAKKMIDKYGSFRESLTKGEWLTSEVLLETFKQISGAYKESELRAQGYTATQAKEIVDLAKAATKSATEVRTVTGMFDAMKESVQSGWAISWEHIIGNKEQATETLTAVKDAFEDLIGPSTEARNNMLEFWNQNGGRDAMLKGLANVFQGLGKVMGSIGDAWKEVFPPMTGKKLVELSTKFKDFTEKMKLSDSAIKKIKDTFKGVFNVFKTIGSAVGSVIKAFSPLTAVFPAIGNAVVSVTSTIGNFITGLTDALSKAKVFDTIANVIRNSLNGIGDFLSDVSNGVTEFFNYISSLDFSKAFDFVGRGFKGITSALTPIFSGIGKAIGTINFQTIMDALKTASFLNVLKTLKDTFGEVSSVAESAKGMFSSFKGIGKNIKDTLDAAREALEAWQQNIKADTLLKIAGAVAVLTASLILLSSIDGQKLAVSLAGMAAVMGELSLAYIAMMKYGGTSSMFSKGIGGSLLAMATSILILAAALKILSGLDAGQMLSGITGVLVALGALAIAVKVFDTQSKNLERTSKSLIVFGIALMAMAGAIKLLGGIDAETLGAGLFAMFGLLAELAAFLAVAKFGDLSITTSTGVLILAAALLVLSQAVKMFGQMDTTVILTGLAAIGAMLAELAIFSALAGGGVKMVTIAAGLMAMSAAILVLSGAMKSLGSMQWDELGRGLLSMAGSLSILGVASQVLSGLQLGLLAVGVAAMGAALIVLGGALKLLGTQSWDEVAISLISLAGALAILAVAMNAMNGGLVGAAAMVVMAGALALLAPQLILLGQMDLMGVGIALAALAGTFTVLGVAGLLLTPVVPTLIALGVAVALLGVGCAAAGAGIALFGTGLGLVAAAVGASGMLILEFFRQLINLLPQLGLKAGEAMVNFASAIGNGASTIINAWTQIITALLESVATLAPQIATTGMTVITEFAKALASGIPQLVTYGMQMITGILEGIAANIGSIVQAGADIIVNFLNGVAANLGAVIEAGINLALSFVEGVADGISSNTGRLEEAIRSIIEAMAQAGLAVIKGSISGFTSGGKELLEGFCDGVKSMMDSAGSAVTSCVDSAKKAASNLGSALVSAGEDLIRGLINGITSMASSVARKAREVVEGAISAAKKALGINSPSRVFMEIGKYTVEGLSVGLDRYTKTAEKSASELANGVMRSVANPLAGINDLINGQLDMNPTIKPVLDLSNVEQNSRRLGDLVSGTGTLSLSTDKASLMTSSIGQIQNGKDNADIVSALKDLKASMADNRPSYTVNGITYDDGSNITSAVETLVRAAKIERRI